MDANERRRETKVGTRTFLFRPTPEILTPPKMLPEGGPIFGGWTRPLDELAQRSRTLGKSVRRRTVRMLRESLTCILAIAWVTLMGCAAALGWGRPRRLLMAAVVFAVPCFFLALPPEWVTVRSVSDLVAAGNWSLAAKITATLLGGGLVTFHFVMALVRVPEAREQLPALCLEDRMAQAENLFRTPVTNADELQQWVGRIRRWTDTVEAELRALHSLEIAYAFRRVTPGATVRYQHRYDAVHDGWLNMLAWRRDLIADLLDPRARRSATRAPSEFRQVA